MQQKWIRQAEVDTAKIKRTSSEHQANMTDLVRGSWLGSLSPERTLKMSELEDELQDSAVK